MSGPSRPPSGGVPRQPLTPGQVPGGVTCPACGLGNDAGARTCRNCGLPIAASDDPLRGVAPGRVAMPSAKRSGLSASVGLVMVIGLLLVSGTLAVSGGGILSGGGRLGVAASETAAPSAAALVIPGATADPGEATGETVSEGGQTGPVTHKLGYTCGSGAIRDANDSKWRLNLFKAGSRDGFDRMTFELTRRGGKPQNGTTTTMEWMTPRQARDRFGARVAGNRAIVLTFDGPVVTNRNQRIDQLFLDPAGVTAIRSAETVVDDEGKVRTVVGVRGDGCAAMSSVGWKKVKKNKNPPKRSKVYFDVQTDAQES